MSCIVFLSVLATVSDRHQKYTYLFPFHAKRSGVIAAVCFGSLSEGATMWCIIVLLLLWHLVMPDNLRSLDKGGSHSTLSAIVKRTLSYTACKLRMSMFYRTGVTANGSFTLWEYGVPTFVAPVTLTQTRWPSYTKLTRIPSRFIGCAKWTSYIMAFESSRLTHIHTAQTDRLTLTDMIKICGWSNIKHIHITVIFGTQKVIDKTKFHVTFIQKISVLFISNVYFRMLAGHK